MTNYTQADFTISDSWEPDELKLDNHGRADGTAAIASAPPLNASTPLLGGRLKGPGGLYNVGNLIALTAGILAQIAQSPGDEGMRDMITAYLFGNPGATWLTVSMLIFLVAGECYHRAWVGADAPDVQLVRLGDFLSGIGALAVTMALLSFGDILLAGVAGTLLAGGKFGSALFASDAAQSARRAKTDRAFRYIVILSRFPSLASLTLTIMGIVVAGTALTSAIMPAIMLFCFSLWLAADILLIRVSAED